MKDMKKIKEQLSKPLSVKDIDFRIQSINNGGYGTVLAYKDARVDMNRLDEVCGVFGWQRDHKEIHDVVYCGIGIFDTESSQWVWKWDAGAESFTEKQKGEASDSFKRAGFNWGIGRELYGYPLVQIKFKPSELREHNGKKALAWGVDIRKWKWHTEFDKDGLKVLGCRDTNGGVRFLWKRED